MAVSDSLQNSARLAEDDVVDRVRGTVERSRGLPDWSTDFLRDDLRVQQPGLSVLVRRCSQRAAILVYGSAAVAAMLRDDACPKRGRVAAVLYQVELSPRAACRVKGISVDFLFLLLAVDIICWQLLANRLGAEGFKMHVGGFNTVVVVAASCLRLFASVDMLSLSMGLTGFKSEVVQRAGA